MTLGRGVGVDGRRQRSGLGVQIFLGLPECGLCRFEVRIGEQGLWSQKPIVAEVERQRNARIVGIFARLNKRDGKPRYLQFMPRVWGHLNRDLENPAMADLKAWYARTIPMEKRTATYGAAA